MHHFALSARGFVVTHRHVIKHICIHAYIYDQALAINTDKMFDAVMADSAGKKSMGTHDLHNAFHK
jgi:hypothetical protein